MASTTTNFAFDVPTSSDLVKNGATQIALLGQDIDTFLAGSPTYTGGKNLQMNGNMNIAQRGTSFAAVVNDYTLDRFNCRNNNLGVFTVSKETDAPAGFGSSMKWLCTTADASPAAADFAVLRTSYEGQQLQALAKGTSSSKTTMMSFWVKSNLTGTYLFSIFDADNTRRISATYTINASATWEKKSITIAGDTTGLLDNDANASMQLQWVLGSGTDRTSGTYQSTWGANVTANEYAGQTANVAATINNYWMITGIQWEIGTTVTPFQLSTGTIQGELAACQRYYWRYAATANANTPFVMGIAYSTTAAQFTIPYPVTMRTVPATLDYSGVVAQDVGTGTSYGFTAMAINQAGVNSGQIVMTGGSGLTQYRGYLFKANNTVNDYIGLSAEL